MDTVIELKFKNCIVKIFRTDKDFILLSKYSLDGKILHEKILKDNSEKE